jgi:hypothetical protein
MSLKVIVFNDVVVVGRKKKELNFKYDEVINKLP